MEEALLLTIAWRLLEGHLVYYPGAHVSNWEQSVIKVRPTVVQ